MERKLFTALQGDQAVELNDTLSKQGFRRSQNVLYRPSCTECSACYSARIRVADFVPSKSQRRTENKNAQLMRRTRAPWATEEQYALFRAYLDDRHADGGMADMDVFEFAAMIEETPIKSRVIEYSTPPEEPGGARRLTAVCLTDVLDDGLSMVYSFFDPARAADSLGTYVILDHVRLAAEAGLPYVYLGYWVPGSPKMDYKSRFSALEIYAGGRWMALDNPAEFSADPHPLASDPIAEQVAKITLPGASPVKG
jgi:arginine-tRNA-protein transferase